LAAILFEKNYSNGVYKEYYPSGKLILEIPFIKLEDSFHPHGVVKRYYEGEDDITQSDVYVLIEETNFLNGTRIGLQKTYYTNGQLQSETMYESSDEVDHHVNSTKFYKTYYVTNGNLSEEAYPNWGKKYYESGKLLAEWKSNNYFKIGDYIEKYPDGLIKLKVNYVDGDRDGLMYKYSNDGKILELWKYEKGKRNFVKKYFENGMLKTEWLYDTKGKEISKHYYDEKGNLKKKN
jgi:antitoxin component YwqK of YwqJK toxin-antitoxin module